MPDPNLTTRCEIQPTFYIHLINHPTIQNDTGQKHITVKGIVSFILCPTYISWDSISVEIQQAATEKELLLFLYYTLQYSIYKNQWKPYRDINMY